ncbi:MAG: hypothetical protein HeimAB125_06690 [Candidatus Heimdallarchaeota archaeon AB_125]|nr:MAG: hypothetical protein HeimAB125_06690 [Candidatus Heimdallarchaeota archaeon AB_125]
MSISFELDQRKANAVMISSRKIMLNKGQLEIFEKLLECIMNAMPTINRSGIEAILKHSCREWEKEKVRPINEFRFIHANERMKAFDEILIKLFFTLKKAMIHPLNDETIAFLRNAILTSYKDFLEAEGYVVDFLP